MTIQIECRDPWFSFISNGIKTIEGRRFSKWSHLKAGDLLLIHLPDFSRSIEKRIDHIKVYPTLKDYVSSEPLQVILPGIKTVEDGIKVYTQFGAGENEPMMAIFLEMT